jgi:hypothetical protein
VNAAADARPRTDPVYASARDANVVVVVVVAGVVVAAVDAADGGVDAAACDAIARAVDAAEEAEEADDDDADVAPDALAHAFAARRPKARAALRIIASTSERGRASDGRSATVRRATRRNASFAFSSKIFAVGRQK